MLGRMIYRAWHVHGLWGTACLLYDRLISLTTASPRDTFDATFGVDTDGNSVPRGAPALSERYQTMRPELFHEMMAAADLSEGAAFIDIGSGKGRLLLLASLYPFRKIVGVEFDRDLHAIARRNIVRFKHPDQKTFAIETICGDATRYEFPLTPLVVMLANPFRGALMRTMLNEIERSLREHPRPCVVLYKNPVEREMWDASGFTRTHITPLYAIYRGS